MYNFAMKTNINVLEIKGGQRVLVHFHGFSGCKEENQPLIEFCKENNITFYGMDFPGQGSVPITKIDKPDLNYYADLAIDFIKTLDCKELIISGHSMGGAIALLVAHRLTSKCVQQVILEDPVNLGLLYNKEESDKVCKGCQAVTSHLVFLNNKLTHQDLDSQQKEWFYKLAQNFTSTQLLQQLENITKTFEVDFDVIWGMDDKVVDYATSVQAFRSVKKKSKIKIHSIEHAAHKPHSENVDAYLIAIRKIIH